MPGSNNAPRSGSSPSSNSSSFPDDPASSASSGSKSKQQHQETKKNTMDSSSTTLSSSSKTVTFSESQWIIYVVVPLVLAIIWLYTYHLVRTALEPIHNRHICLLIAHPDDEAMFFAPSILALTKPELQNTISVICFSSGDADGLGEIRKKELVKSCERLGIPSHPTSVTVLEHPSLPDSMTTEWPAATVGALLAKTLSAQPDVDTLLTFDRDGVSSHPNHVAVMMGARHFISKQVHQHPVLLYTLTSVALHRKYAGILDGTTTLLLRFLFGKEGWGGEGAPREALFVSGWNGYRAAQNAMTAGHQSQMRWFRWGWIVLSRYMVINDLKLVDVV